MVNHVRFKVTDHHFPLKGGQSPQESGWGDRATPATPS